MKGLEKAIERVKEEGISSTHNWSNIYLQYHASRKNEKECLSLLSSLISSHISSFTVHDFIFVIKHLGTKKEILQELEKIWEELHEKGFVSNSYVSTTFATAYARLGDMESAG